MFLFVFILLSLIISRPTFAASTPYLNELNISGTQWVEIYNPDTASVDLTGWKIGNQSGSQFTIGSLNIGATSYASVTLNPTIFKNDESNYVELLNSSGSVDRAPSYSPNTLSGYSWSRQSKDNWCVANTSQNAANNACLVTPTPTPTVTPTATITPIKASTPTPTKEPTPTLEVAPTLEPTSSVPTPTTAVATIGTAINTGVTTSSVSAPKSHNIGIIFIIAGGILLLIPLIITQAPKWKAKIFKK